MSITLRRFKHISVFVVGAMLSGGYALAQTSAISLDAAVRTATQWVTLADANQADRMWSSSDPVMKKNISKEDWTKYLGSVQKELGHINTREWVQIARMTNPTNFPSGEYVNIAFSSRFTNATAVEKISLVQTADGWTPVGYVVTKFEAPSAAAAVSGK
jgi:Protein of unknown function (DUF4019)